MRNVEVVEIVIEADSFTPVLVGNGIPSKGFGPIYSPY